MTIPMVSVVIPVFNRQKSCLAAVASVQAQRGVFCEIIIVDDSSEKPFILNGQTVGPHTLRIIRHESNKGAAAARNTGIKAANSRWIAFLDSDDLWHTGKLAEQIALAEQSPKLTCVMSGFRRVSLATGACLNRIPIDSREVSDFAAGCWFAPGSTSLVPADAFATVGLMDTSLARLEDLDWYLRLAIAGGGVVTVRKVYADIHVSKAASASIVDDAVQRLRDKWLAGTPKKLPDEAARSLAAYLALEQAKARLGDRQYARFSKSLMQSFLLRPRVRLPLRHWWSTDA